MRSCGFKSHLPHNTKKGIDRCQVFGYNICYREEVDFHEMRYAEVSDVYKRQIYYVSCAEDADAGIWP